MPEHSSQVPRDWREAFAALPEESAPPGGWAALSARLDARLPTGASHRRRRARWPMWASGAAALALAIALPWRDPVEPAGPAAPDPATIAAAPTDPLEQLQLESAQLEALLSFARDDRVSSATAALLADAYETRLAAIDAALVQPGLSREAQLSLWQQRVEGLRGLSGFESNRRWLAAQGTRYDGALVLVD
ncbi:hypothetical protein [Luteimonas sp. SDU101]|uniref:hypothetical protein n=1 Tax=Luteimonas sp. SDU101 TaxID=3422593 RepID=UPI003EC0F34B